MRKNMKTEIGKSMHTLKAKKLRFYILGVALPVVQILIFYFYANFNSILLAFQDYNGSSFDFVGFDNFVGIFNGTHPRLIKFNMGYILKNSFLSFGMELLFGSLPAILFSYYIYKKYPAAGAFKIILYIPHIIPSIIFVILYKYFVGSAIPEIYEKLTGENLFHMFDGVNVERTRALLIFFTIYISFGTRILLYTGTMSGISESIIESAKLDGITPMKELFLIVIPMIWGTIVTFIVVSIVGLFTGQMSAYSFFGEGLEMQLYTFGYYIFMRASKSSMYEYPVLSALGLIMTAIAVPVTLAVKHFMTKYGPSVD